MSWNDLASIRAIQPKGLIMARGARGYPSAGGTFKGSPVAQRRAGTPPGSWGPWATAHNQQAAQAAFENHMAAYNFNKWAQWQSGNPLQYTLPLTMPVNQGSLVPIPQSIPERLRHTPSNYPASEAFASAAKAQSSLLTTKQRNALRSAASLLRPFGLLGKVADLADLAVFAANQFGEMGEPLWQFEPQGAWHVAPAGCTPVGGATHYVTQLGYTSTCIVGVGNQFAPTNTTQLTPSDPPFTPEGTLRSTPPGAGSHRGMRFFRHTHNDINNNPKFQVVAQYGRLSGTSFAPSVRAWALQTPVTAGRPWLLPTVDPMASPIQGAVFIPAPKPLAPRLSSALKAPERGAWPEMSVGAQPSLGRGRSTTWAPATEIVITPNSAYKREVPTRGSVKTAPGREKEQKFRWSWLGQALADVTKTYDRVDELTQALDILYDNIQGYCPARNRVEKMICLWVNFDKIAWDTAALELVQNHIEDAVLGRVFGLPMKTPFDPNRPSLKWGPWK